MRKRRPGCFAAAAPVPSVNRYARRTLSATSGASPPSASSAAALTAAAAVGAPSEAVTAADRLPVSPSVAASKPTSTMGVAPRIFGLLRLTLQRTVLLHAAAVDELLVALAAAPR